MPADYNHLSPTDAIALQKELRSQVSLVPLEKDIRTVAGADISFNKFSEIVYAGIVVLSYPGLEVIETATAVSRITFPYIPGLLAFREVPAVQEAWQKLAAKPDVLVMDGHGIAHPRRIGIATHFGILENTPTLGCAKSLLSGNFTMPGNDRFAESELVYRGETVGVALRTKTNCRPVFISPGHLVTLQQSVEIVKNCTGAYRVPEPTRQAHLLVNRLRVEHKL